MIPALLRRTRLNGANPDACHEQRSIDAIETPGMNYTYNVYLSFTVDSLWPIELKLCSKTTFKLAILAHGRFVMAA